MLHFASNLLWNPIVVHDIHERDIAVLESREVDNNFVPLTHGKQYVFGTHGIFKESSIGGNDLDFNRVVFLVNKRKIVGATERNVVESEAILPRFNIKIRPRLSVDFDGVAVEIYNLTFG